MMPLPPRYLLPVPLPTPFRPGDPRHLDPLGLHVRDTSDPHKVRDRLVDIGVLRKNGDGTYSPYLPTKADLVNGKVPASQLPEDQQGVTQVLVDGVSVVTGGTASIDLTGKVDKEKGKGLSSNDYTTEEKTKLASAIQAVKVNGTALAPDAQRAVNIPAASTSVQGVVKLNNATNSTSQTEAATANAARLAYNRGSEGLNKANQVDAAAAKTSDDNYFYGRNTFSADTAFGMRPSVSSPGMCYLIATDYPESSGDVNATNVGGYFYWYDDSGGEHYISDVFSGGAIHTILDANQIDFDEYDAVFFYSSGTTAVPSIDLSNSWNSPIVMLVDNGGGYEFLGYANTGESILLSSLYRNAYGPDGENDWYRYAGEVELVAEDLSSYYGRVPVEITWKVTGRYIEAHVEYFWTSFMPYEGYESLSVDTEGYYSQTPPPYSLQASTDPANPYYSTSYAETPDTYGWAPCLDSEVATLDNIPDIPDVGGAVSAHNSNQSAHSNISLAAARITSGTLAAARIPDLAASKITSGTFNAARIPDLAASKITSGTFNAARIPNLDAGKITSGVFDAARVPMVLPSSFFCGSGGSCVSSNSPTLEFLLAHTTVVFGNGTSAFIFRPSGVYGDPWDYIVTIPTASQNVKDPLGALSGSVIPSGSVPSCSPFTWFFPFATPQHYGTPDTNVKLTFWSPSAGANITKTVASLPKSVLLGPNSGVYLLRVSGMMQYGYLSDAAGMYLKGLVFCVNDAQYTRLPLNNLEENWTNRPPNAHTGVFVCDPWQALPDEYKGDLFTTV